MAEVVLALLCTALGVLLRSALTALQDWRRSRRRIRVSVSTDSGPATREFGFTEKALKVTVTNNGSEKVEIRDLRLMFAQEYGAPVPKSAPPPRSHTGLPSTLNSGAAKTWYFPAEKLAGLLQSVSSGFPAGQKMAKLRPQATTTTDKVYRGSAFRFSMDVNSHWP